MDADRPAEPDVASLFAPVAVEETFDGVLIEARQVLGYLDDPVDAELWGSDLIGALASSAAGQDSLMNTLTGTLVPAAEAASTPEALALLRVFAAQGVRRGPAYVLPLARRVFRSLGRKFAQQLLGQLSPVRRGEIRGEGFYLLQRNVFRHDPPPG